MDHIEHFAIDATIARSQAAGTAMAARAHENRAANIAGTSLASSLLSLYRQWRKLATVPVESDRLQQPFTLKLSSPEQQAISFPAGTPIAVVERAFEAAQPRFNLEEVRAGAWHLAAAELQHARARLDERLAEELAAGVLRDPEGVAALLQRIGRNGFTGFPVQSHNQALQSAREAGLTCEVFEEFEIAMELLRAQREPQVMALLHFADQQPRVLPINDWLSMASAEELDHAMTRVAGERDCASLWSFLARETGPDHAPFLIALVDDEGMAEWVARYR